MVEPQDAMDLVIKRLQRDMILKVKKRLELNPRRSANQLAKDLKISDLSIRRILKNSYENLSHRLPTKRQYPPQLMVWAAVTEPGFKVISSTLNTKSPQLEKWQVFSRSKSVLLTYC